jgi:putative protease
MQETEIGKVLHFFDKLSVAAIRLSGELKVGDKVRIEAEMPFVQVIDSMQADRKEIKHAKEGDDIGIRTIKPCRDNDRIVRIS